MDTAQRLKWHHLLTDTIVRHLLFFFKIKIIQKIFQPVSDFPSTSTGITRNDCSECHHQTMMNQKLEMENMKTKSKLDQLKLVMREKKERREARKLKIAPYNSSQHVPSPPSSISTSTLTTPVPAHVSPSSSAVNGNNLNRMNSETTAITISSENHLEEVDTVA